MGIADITVASSWLGHIGSVSDVVVAVATVVGLIFGLAQLRRIAEANQNQVDIARAEFLLEIDARFEAPEMQASRLAIRSLRNYGDDCAKQERVGESDIAIAARSDELMSKELTALYQRFKTADHRPDPTKPMVEQPDDKDGFRYFVLMRVPYWAETIGLLTRANLLNLDDVLNLYDVVFIRFITGFLKHTEDRQSEGPVRNDSFLENMLWLRDQAGSRENNQKLLRRASRAPRRGQLAG